MRAGKLVLLLIAAALLALPAAASAKTFTVNGMGDGVDANPGDGQCETASMLCSLRAAVGEANANGSADTIKFDSGIFNGELADLIQLSTPLFASGDAGNLTIGAGDCGDETFSHKPCAEVRAPTAGGDRRALSIGGSTATIRGLAITHADTGGGIQFAAGNAHRVTNTWFGVKLDGTTVDANVVGLDARSAGGDAIGGKTGSDRNVFVGGTDGLRIIRANETRVRGNYFGVLPDGVTASAATDFDQSAIEIVGTTNPVDRAVDNVIGASIDSSHRATEKCDGGCNVIANADGAGIDLDPGGISFPEGAQRTIVKGNFIGIAADGLTAVANAVGVDNGTADQTAIGGDTSAKRNFIAGGTTGIRATFSAEGAPDDLEIKRNFVGLSSSGTSALAAPTGEGIDVLTPTTSLVSRNRLAGASGVAIRLSTVARVVRNKIGLDKNGNDEPGPGTGIRVTGSVNTIGEPDAGNTIGNTLNQGIEISPGSLNKVQGNYIGVDSAGTAHPSSGLGILIQDASASADDNKIGGTSGATENVISNSANDAIRIQNNGTPSTGNQIKRNRGKNNGAAEGANGLFIDLQGTQGFGNSSGLNGGIDAPTITNVEPGDVTRSHIEGTGAEPNATIYIFRTSAAAGASPNRINAFVKTKQAGGSGNFSTNFSKIPSGQQLTVLQLDPTDGSSELALAVAPPGP